MMASTFGPPIVSITNLAQSVCENNSVVPVMTRVIVLTANSRWMTRQVMVKRRK